MDCAHLNKAQAAPRNSACSERRFEGCKGLFNLAGQDDRTGKRRNVADGRGHCHTRKRHTASRCGHLRKCGVRHLYPEVGEGEGGRDPVIWRFAIEREDWIRRGCRKAGGYHTLYALTPFTVPFLIEFDHARVTRVIELFKKRRQRGTGRCKEAQALVPAGSYGDALICGAHQTLWAPLVVSSFQNARSSHIQSCDKRTDNPYVYPNVLIRSFSLEA